MHNSFKSVKPPKPMLKSDIHMHSKEDPEDDINYTAKDLIRLAAKCKYDILSFSFHNRFFYPKDIISFAKSKGILLMPGTELNIQNKDVLLTGIKEFPNIRKIEDLEKIKDSVIITAPHPFFPTQAALKNELIKHINLFDNIEFTARYTKLVNFNKKAVSVAKKYNKPLFGNSDCHNIEYFNHTFTYIDAEKTINSVLDAIKKRKFRMETKPLPMLKLARIGINNVYNEYIVKKISPRK